MIYVYSLCKYKVIGLESVIKYQPFLVFSAFVSGSAVYTDPLKSSIKYT